MNDAENVRLFGLARRSSHSIHSLIARHLKKYKNKIIWNFQFPSFYVSREWQRHKVLSMKYELAQMVCFTNYYELRTLKFI